MKRRTFFQTTTALLASVLMPWKPRPAYSETMENGWKVIRADVLHIHEPFALTGRDKLKVIANELHIHCECAFIANSDANVCLDVSEIKKWVFARNRSQYGVYISTGETYTKEIEGVK